MSGRWSLALALVFAAEAACDFDAAFARYCDGNAACEGGDGGTGGAGDGGSGGTGGAGPVYPANCTDTGDCRANEACHPVGKVCVPTCESSTDCPAGQNDCIPLRYSGGEPTAVHVCACRFAMSCARENPGTTCSPVDNACEPLCGSDEDCAGFAPARICDRASGVCVIEPIACTGNADCTNPYQPRCDLTVERCAGCIGDFDCRDRTDGRTRCDPRGACVPPR